MSNTSTSLKQKLETVSIDDITPREGNPNEMSEKKTTELEFSIKNIGYVQPIIVDQNNVIIDGANRYEALKAGGAQYVDILRLEVRDENQRTLISQAMNKIRGQHNTDKDIQELRNLIGYDSDALYQLLHVDETSLDELQQKHEEEQQALRDLEKKQYNKEIRDEDRKAALAEAKERRQLVLDLDENYIDKLEKITMAGNFGNHASTLKYLIDEHMKAWGQESIETAG